LNYEKIITTEAKAKEVRSLTERMITLGKDGSLASRRRALAFITDKKVVKKLFDEIALEYNDRTGGYTRLVKLGPRPGDNAPMAQIELVK
jgi:large subunit ribosomal protein L17